MRHKITLSIQPDVKIKGQQRANEIFSGNFSMYVTYLINKDIMGIVEHPSGARGFPEINSKPISQEDLIFDKHKSEVNSAIDNILAID